MHKFLKGVMRGALPALLMLMPAAALNAQDARVVFPEISMSIEGAFSEIEKQTDYLISVSHTNFDMSRKVRLTRNNLSVRDALDQLLARSGRRFSVHGHHIVIFAPNGPVPEIPAEEPEPEELEVVVEEPAMPEIDWTKPPVDVDSLERALRARKVDFPAEIPPEPFLNKTVYYNLRDIRLDHPGIPDYVFSLPKIALRTNLLYGIAALAPNLGVELGLTPRSTLLLSGSYNGWNLNDETDNKKLCHWLASAEYRYWLCERFNGHFFGIHGFYGYYNIAEHKLPLILEDGSEDYRYKGSVFGAGVSYGYQMPIASKWNVEFNVGVGFGAMKYDKFDCDRCSDELEKDVSRTFVAPTKLGISLVYIIK